MKLLLILGLVSFATATDVYWWVYKGSDCPYRDVGEVGKGHTVDFLEKTCLDTPGCYGFNTNGILKNITCDNNIDGGEPCDLYVRETTPQPPPPPKNWPPIWPHPVSFSNGTHKIAVDAANFKFVATKPSADLTAAAARYMDLTFPHKSGPNTGLHTLTIDVDDLTAPLQLEVDESYTLTVDTDGTARVTAKTVYGAYHGLETFSQLVRFDFDTETYSVGSGPWKVTDSPRFPHRGLLIDSSRHFESVTTIKSVIDSLTYAKMNTLHWHIVDMQSFPFDSPSYPRLAKYGAYSSQERFTTDDVAEVVEHARARGIRVMVEIDTPGHASAMCYGYPEICPSKTCLTPLNPATNATFDLLAGLFKDLTGGKARSGLFPDDFFHLGGDEVNTDCWSKTPEVKQWMDSMGFTADQTYEYFVKRVFNIALDQGRQPVQWEEVWNHFHTDLDPKSIVHIWLPGSTTLPNVTASGYRALFSPDGLWYLDGLSVDWEKFYTVEPCAGIPASQEHLVLGGEVCMWGETVDGSDIFNTIWPRAAAGAERLWSPRDITDTDLAHSRLQSFRCLLNRRGIGAAPVDNKTARQGPPGPGGCLTQ